MHISDGSIPAGRVAGCSCTIPASPTTTGLCTLFIACRVMRIRPGMATPGRRPARRRLAAAAAPSASAAAAFLLLLRQDKVAGQSSLGSFRLSFIGKAPRWDF